MPIPIISTLVPSNNGGFATHDSKYGLGGWVSVNALSDMYNISQLRLAAGMACRIVSLNQTYILSADLANWVLEKSGGSTTNQERSVEQYATNPGTQYIQCDPAIQQNGFSLYVNGLLQSSDMYAVNSNIVTVSQLLNIVSGDFITFFYNIGI